MDLLHVSRSAISRVCSAGAGRLPGHQNKLTTLTLANFMKILPARYAQPPLVRSADAVLGLNEALICIAKTLALPPTPESRVTFRGDCAKWSAAVL